MLAFAIILGLMLVFALTGVGIILMPLFLLDAIIVAGFGGIAAKYLLDKISLENISGFAPDQRRPVEGPRFGDRSFIHLLFAAFFKLPGVFKSGLSWHGPDNLALDQTYFETSPLNLG